MSDRELAYAVRDERIVFFYTPALTDPLSGFVCGWDDYHWRIITDEGHIHLIHKGTTPLLRVGPHQQMKDETRKLVDPFKAYLDRTFFNRQQGREEGIDRDRVAKHR